MQLHRVPGGGADELLISAAASAYTEDGITAFTCTRHGTDRSHATWPTSRVERRVPLLTLYAV
jgi:hypothetical protein